MTFVSQMAGERMHGLIRRLFPFCRSITGNGVRDTLKELQRHIPLTLHEVPTGTPVFDWVVPREWNIRAARIEALDGRTLVDFAECNLHVVGYSTPIDAVVSREELAAHVHTVPEQPLLIPYRTAYYAETWGFCIAHRDWEMMRDAHYRVVIDSDLTDGALIYGELVVPGIESDEVLISAHCCHPSLANDNLSGIAVSTELARHVMKGGKRLTYRFLFAPATIGSLTWLAQNEAAVRRIVHGLILTCVGDSGSFHYKESRRGNAAIDRAVAHVLKRRDPANEIMPFTPFGYDERQYCSPGFDLPVGCFMRTPNGAFPQYHTSADDSDFVTADALAESLETLVEIVDVLENDVAYSRTDGRGEPHLGRRGLYRQIGGDKGDGEAALPWVLNLADGRHSLLDMVDRSGLPFRQIANAAEVAAKAGLIRRADGPR